MEGEHSITAKVSYGTDGIVISEAVTFTAQAAAQPGETNIALGKPVTVSAISSGTAESLTDGVTNETTGNSVWYVNISKALGAYADVELGLNEINKIAIHHGMGSGTNRLTNLCSTVS